MGVLTVTPPEVPSAASPVTRAAGTPSGRALTSAGLPRLADYLDFVRRQRVLLALFVVVGLVAGWGWSASQPRTYTASTSVVLAPVPVYVIPATAGLLPPEVSIDTDAQLLQSPEVLAAIGLVTGERTAEVVEHLSVTATPQSHVLHLHVSAASASLAARAADAAAAALVEVRRRALGALTQGQLRQLRLYVAGQEALLAREQARRLVVPGQDDLFSQVEELRNGLRELEEARRTPAQVVGRADVPTRPDHANTEVPTTSGAMLGLLAGWLVGSARDRARRARATPVTSRPEDEHHAI